MCIRDRAKILSICCHLINHWLEIRLVCIIQCIVCSVSYTHLSTEEKSRPLTQAPSGIIGLETALALGITNLVRPGHLSPLQLMDCLLYTSQVPQPVGRLYPALVFGYVCQPQHHGRLV